MNSYALSYYKYKLQGIFFMNTLRGKNKNILAVAESTNLPKQLSYYSTSNFKTFCSNIGLDSLFTIPLLSFNSY